MRSNDSPVMYRSAADPPQDCVSDKLDSVERSIQTLESYLDTLQTAWACTHTELAIECFKEFKQKLHRGEAAVERAYRTPATPAPTPVSDLVRRRRRGHGRGVRKQHREWGGDGLVTVW